MSKLDDYEFKDVNQQQIDFKDDVRDLLNNGKYQASLATTGIPGWAAGEGEFAFYTSGSDRRLYLRAATSWQLVAGFDSTLQPSALGTVNTGTGNTFAPIDHIHPLTGIEGGFNSMQAFTTAGTTTWTTPAGVTVVYAKGWGAGGGGGGGAGGAAADGGGGGQGGGGQYGETLVAVSGDFTVVIGAGGAGGAGGIDGGGAGGVGGNGGHTTFGPLKVTAGSGGTGGTSTAEGSGGAGATVGSGALLVNGRTGNQGSAGTGGGIRFVGQYTPGTRGGHFGGCVGSLTRGLGGQGGLVAASDGTVGEQPGGGGGGGAAKGASNGVGGAGGAGGTGLLILYWSE